jgi:hypothetical protein
MVKILRRFFANFCHEIGCENDLTYIFRFIKYLSTFFYTYLPVNIHFQLIIITNVSILTNPAYFTIKWNIVSLQIDVMTFKINANKIIWFWNISNEFVAKTYS